MKTSLNPSDESKTSDTKVDHIYSEEDLDISMYEACLSDKSKEASISYIEMDINDRLFSVLSGVKIERF